MSFGKETRRGRPDAECAGAECQLVPTGLKEPRSGLPVCDTQQCCVLLPVRILITELHLVKSCGQLYCSKIATTVSPIPQAFGNGTVPPKSLIPLSLNLH